MLNLTQLHAHGNQNAEKQKGFLLLTSQMLYLST